MLDFTTARDALRDRLPADKFYKPEALSRYLVRGWEKFWRARPWQFTIKRGQFRTNEIYNTGGVLTLTNGTKAVTFTGATLDNTFIGRYLRVGSELRDYRIATVPTSSTCTLDDYYEGTSITSSTAYQICEKIKELPGDCASIISAKESYNQNWLSIVPRHVFERQVGGSKQVSGIAEYLVEAGFRTSPIESTGTLAMVGGSASVTGTSTLFDARMEGQELRVDGYPFSFIIKTVTSTTAIVLDRPWPFSDQALATYKVGPAGTPLVELYPVHDHNGSVEIWYHRKPPDIVNGWDVPAMYGEYDTLWLDCALSEMGMFDEMLLEKRLGDMADRDGIERESVRQLDAPGGAAISGGLRASAASPATPWYED